jgi:site-specific DNA-methyltransferase (adenine-specific)
MKAMITTNSIYNCDCVEGMKKLDAESVDLTVTSPPYDTLRKYNGFKFDFESTVKELFRITKIGGVVVWVVDDRTKNGDEQGIPFKQCLFFKECGFTLHDTMIWTKDGGGAVGSEYTYKQNFEYMFVFSKGRPKAINLIFDKTNKSYGIDKSGAGRRRRNGEIRRENRQPAKPFSKRNNWWYIPPQKGGKHPAVFPERLATDHILSWSNEGDVVLDPFMGSGTTGVACIKNNRKYIGFEISKEYCELAEKRISETTLQECI